MPNSETPIYLDWQFWSAVAALTAIALSQLPPVYLWFRPRRLDVEVHSRIQVTHKVGNPNVALYVSVNNTGGRQLRVTGMRLAVARDGSHLCELPAQNYFEAPSSQSSVLFVPFMLKPGESWAHATNFLKFFDRATEKLYREGESALGADIRRKLSMRAETDNKAVSAETHLIKPFLDLFEKLFVWLPGEYVIELTVTAKPGAASFSKKYRFTLYESDSADLRSHTHDYQFGGGLSYNVERHVGVFVPLADHRN